MARKNNEWGPLGGIELKFAAAFVSTMIPIELTWADDKNYFARQPLLMPSGETRSLAHVHDMLLNRLEGQAGEDYSKSVDLFEHCYKEMNKYIARDKEMDPDSPLEGTIGSLSGIPDAEEYKIWQERAGVSESLHNLSGEINLAVGEEAALDVLLDSGNRAGSDSDSNDSDADSTS